MSTPAPGGRTRDAREEIARWLAGTIEWTVNDAAREHYRADADDLIKSCPTIADALAAVERVRALAEELARKPHTETPLVARVAVARDLRRALDGQP